MGCLEPRWGPLPRLEVSNSYEAVDKFLEDLGLAEDICYRPAVHPEYGRLKRFVCNGDVDAVADAPWNGVISFATYYLIFHRRDLETARRAIELLKFRDLNEEEEAMLKILEVAYSAAANPPCGDPKALSRYVEKVRDVPEPSERVALLKGLVLMHLTGRIYAETLKNRIKQTYKSNEIIIEKCNKKRCTKEVKQPSLPFHYFAFYIVDRITPLCPQQQAEQKKQKDVFDECLDERRSFRKAVEAALVPAAVAALAFLFHGLFVPFALLVVFYAWWVFYQNDKIDTPICIHKVWSNVKWIVAVASFAPLAAFGYVSATAANTWNALSAVGLVGIALATLGGISTYNLLAPGRPHGVDFPRTGARDEHREYRRFLEDLVDTWNMQDMCNGWLPFEHYNKLRALVCRGDLEAAGKVSEGWPLIFAAYYLIFHSRDLETARKVLNLLRSRNLGEKEKAALEILEVASEVVANPPCGSPEALRQYVEKIRSVQTYGWASVLKTLVVAHLTCDQEHKDNAKLAALWAAKRCGCDNPSICYFAYRLLNRIKPLCSCPV